MASVQPRGICPTVLEILDRKTVVADDGSTRPLVANVSLDECEFIASLIDSDPTICRTLEVGFAYGISSSVILWATAGREGARHVILDPCQSTEYGNIGHNTLRRAGLDHYEFIEEGSEYALPRMAAAQPGSFDLVLIDGFHTFDHTLVDLFYANRLLRVGGVVVVDDTGWPSVARAMSYFRTYPAYVECATLTQSSASLSRRLARFAGSIVPRSVQPYVLSKKLFDAVDRARYSSMVAFKKVREDDRPWNWYPSW